MGLLDLFSAIFGYSAPVNALARGRGWTVPVVGEAPYQGAISSLYRKQGGRGHDLKVIATVTPEDGNEFDADAVRVEIDGRRVGYLSRELAAEYRAALGETAGQCRAKIVGGFELGDGSTVHLGVKLHMAWPPRLKSR
jgi:hypothetical protein